MITGEAEDSEMIPNNHVTTVVKQAISTFKSRPELFEPSLEKLIQLFNKTRSHHVNLHPMFMQETTWNTPTKAPMTYIGIYHNDVLNMGIFILKQNMVLPLHNHPKMYGLLKVIAGTVRVKSFSIKSEEIISDEYGERLNVIGERNTDIEANPEMPCCRLDPDLGNIHEIETIGGPAAFIDILAPPYDINNSDVTSRKCSYFRILKEVKPRLFELQEIQIPGWFWSDSYPYSGPGLDIREEEIDREDRIEEHTREQKK